MKIALVYDAVYPWVKGGGEKHLWELAVGLRKRGHEVHCFGMQYWPGPSSIEREGVCLHGVCRARALYDGAGRRSTLPAVLFAAGLFRMLLRKRAGRFDVIDSIVFPFFPIFAIALWRRLSGEQIPWLMTWLEVWGSDYWQRYLGAKAHASVASMIERACSRFGDRHLCISTHQSRRLRDLLDVRADRIEVIPRGLNVCNLPDVVRQHSRVLYCGRLLEYKNVEVLLRAWPQVLASVRSARLRIVGSGPHLSTLHALTEELRLQQSVEFIPAYPEAADALREIAEAAVLVQPSRREGQSLVVLEAQAVGTPVVAALHPESAVSDLIDAGATGILVEQWDHPDAWADAITGLLSDTALRERLARGSRKAVAQFDWDSAIIPRVEALYLRMSGAQDDR